jgi:hypothetical protein
MWSTYASPADTHTNCCRFGSLTGRTPHTGVSASRR